MLTPQKCFHCVIAWVSLKMVWEFIFMSLKIPEDRQVLSNCELLCSSNTSSVFYKEDHCDVFRKPYRGVSIYSLVY